MFGEGFTHGRPVSSYQSSRRQFSRGITVRLTLILFSSLNSFANSPIVMPCRTGIWKYEMYSFDGSDVGPSICQPLIGLGRLRTTTDSFRFAASSITYAIAVW